MSQINNLNISFDHFNLSIGQLEVPDSGVTVFWGPSGAGKTTLFKTLIGIYRPKGWTWHYKNISMEKLSYKDRQLGVVFQNYQLFPHLTAEENIEIVIKARHSKEKQNEIFKLCEEYKKILDLNLCWLTIAENLSGGEKQRVAFLRALICDPRILILDEPFSALDFTLRAESRKLLKSIVSQLTIPVYLITHDQEDVLALADTVIEMENGRVKMVRTV